MIDRQPSRRPEAYEERRPVFLAPARQAPIHLTPTEEQIWLKMSTRMGQVFTGEELLGYAWSRKGLRWEDGDEKTQKNNRQHVIGVMHELRRVLRSHGQYEIDTAYPRADGARGWRLREMTAADRAKLEKKGYLGGSYYQYEHQVAAQTKRPALEAPQEPPPAPASPTDEPDRPTEHHVEVVSPLFSQIGWPVDNEGRAFDGDAQLLEPIDVAGQDAATPELVERG